MWTKREKIINNFDEVISYIKSQDGFHDYRLGNIEFNENTIQIMIEEDTRNKHNENAHIWDFNFKEISELKVSMDCIIPAFISEVDIGGHFVKVGLNNGYISFRAMEISLGVPEL